MGGGPRRRRNPRGGTVPRRRRTPPEHISARLHPASSWRRRLETRTTRNFSGGASGCTARPASRRGAAVALPPLDPPPTQKSPSWGSAASPSWGSAASPSAASPIAWSMGDVLHGEVHLPDAAIRSSLQGQSEPRPTLHALPLHAGPNPSHVPGRAHPRVDGATSPLWDPVTPQCRITPPSYLASVGRRFWGWHTLGRPQC